MAPRADCVFLQNMALTWKSAPTEPSWLASEYLNRNIFLLLQARSCHSKLQKARIPLPPPQRPKQYKALEKRVVSFNRDQTHKLETKTRGKRTRVLPFKRPMIVNMPAIMHEEADKLSAAIVSLKVGTRIIALGKVADVDWYYVQLMDGRSGYVPMDSLGAELTMQVHNLNSDQHDKNKPIDNEQAHKILKENKKIIAQEARSGKPQAQLAYGDSLASTHPFEAVGWWLRAAESNLPEAQYRIGRAIIQGFGPLDRRPEIGIEWLRRASEQGFSPARRALENLATTGRLPAHHRSEQTSQ